MNNNRKRWKITNKMIAKWFGYASANSLNSSRAKDKMVSSVDKMIEYMERRMVEKLTK